MQKWRQLVAGELTAWYAELSDEVDRIRNVVCGEGRAMTREELDRTIQLYLRLSLIRSFSIFPKDYHLTSGNSER